MDSMASVLNRLAEHNAKVVSGDDKSPFAAASAALALAMSRIGAFNLDYCIVKACTNLEPNDRMLRFIMLSASMSLISSGVHDFAWPKWFLDTLSVSDAPVSNQPAPARIEVPPVFKLAAPVEAPRAPVEMPGLFGADKPFVPDRERDRDHEQPGVLEQRRMCGLDRQASPSNVLRLLSENERFFVHYRFRQICDIEDIKPVLMAHEMVRPRGGHGHVQAGRLASMIVRCGFCPRVVSSVWIRETPTSVLACMSEHVQNGFFAGNMRRLLEIMSTDDAYSHGHLHAGLCERSANFKEWASNLETELSARRQRYSQTRA